MVLADLARVLRPGGRLVALTASERYLEPLLAPSTFPFSAENGVAALEPLLRPRRAPRRRRRRRLPDPRRRARLPARHRRGRRDRRRHAARAVPRDRPHGRPRRGEGSVSLTDPDVVRREYATEDGLAARASVYGREEFGEGDARRTALDAIAEVAPRRVLEVGCGRGEFAERLVAELDVDVVAIDQSERMVELTRARGIDARVADVQALPFGDGEFDCVVANWMLYHVPDLDRGLAEVARVLRPEGRLVAATEQPRPPRRALATRRPRPLVGVRAVLRRERGGLATARISPAWSATISRAASSSRTPRPFAATWGRRSPTSTWPTAFPSSPSRSSRAR